ncbi:MAG: glyceraldehyde 3-phosphate dehydrogenase NAD-binding domain-containing protein, partial [Pseudomonadota bacterium]|nr:glyceraldehyde 3-phosphate dehydrogenase NAD-binding domain-containing protein [Pseudomonadota bacterium]
MVTRVAITGFGRIGRLTLRALLESKRKDIKLVAINATGTPERVAHLFEYDSIHGRYHGKIKTTRNSINFGNGAVKLVNARVPKDLPWKELAIDVVLECTG